MKILIIDDEITALTKMKALLTAYGDCTMTTHAEQAQQLFKAAIKNHTPFDLVFIDIQLSQSSGFDILDSLTQLESQADVKASIKIMVTASGTKANLVKAYTRGCDGFLVKPVKRDVLEEKMRDLGLVKTEQLAAKTLHEG
jgi:DNA-binding NarL/FixJ family response regulator